MLVNEQREKERFEEVENYVDEFAIRKLSQKWFQEIYEKVLNIIIKKEKNQRHTVLIIDDDDFVTKVLKKMLKSLNFTVIVSKDGEEGYRAFQQNQQTLKLIIVDYEMPKLSGIECIKNIRYVENLNQWQHLPIILCSGNEGIKYEQEAQEVGAKYLLKPLKASQVKNIIEHYHLAPNS